MNKKLIIYGIVIVLVLLLTFISSGVLKVKNLDKEANSNSVSSKSYDNLPEKCKPPPGYTEELWKEHLGHHAETQDCLKYFN